MPPAQEPLTQWSAYFGECDEFLESFRDWESMNYHQLWVLR